MAARRYEISLRVLNNISLFSHVKISPLLRLHNESRHSHQKLKGFVFIGVYIINRILQKYFTRSLCSLVNYPHCIPITTSRQTKLWEKSATTVAVRFAVGKKGGSIVNRHQGRRVGRQKPLPRERRQNDDDRGRNREFKRTERKASCSPKSMKAWWTSRDKQRTPRCANYVCSENNMLFSRVKISCFRAKAHLVFHCCLCIIIWLRQYARSDWLISGP